jgi:hypothetical protein
MILLKRTRGLLNKEKFFWNFSFWSLQNDFVLSLVSGELRVSPLVHCLFLLFFPLGSSLPFLSVCLLSCPCVVVCC